MNKKQAEPIAVFALAAFLVGYFCYQVVYGIEMTIGPNGTMTFGDMPPGSTVSNITGNAYNGSATINVGPPPLDLTNTTWTIYNATSGSIGTITFKAYTVETGDEKGSLSTNPPPTYIRHLHGKTLEGSWSMGTAVGQILELCSLHPQSGCTDLTITTRSPNHIELQDSHGDIIRLIRNDIPQIAKTETDCSRADLTQDERCTQIPWRTQPNLRRQVEFRQRLDSVSDQSTYAPAPLAAGKRLLRFSNAVQTFLSSWSCESTLHIRSVI